MRRRREILVVLFLAAGCGGTEQSLFGDAPPDGAGGAGAGPSTSASGGGGSPQGGGGTTSGGSAGAAPVSCNGNWGAPQEVFVDTTGARVQSLAITQNELALFYAYGDDDEVLVSSRSSIDDPFGPGTPVPELTAPCSGDQETLFDVSEDALDAYVACAPWNLDCATAPCTVQHASRASTSQPFVGQGVVASTVGSSPAVAGNGLALYTNALDPYADSAVPLFATRPSTSHPFAAAQAIPGARAWTRALLGPEVSPDQLEIYGAELPYADAIVVSQRSNQSDPFPDPIAIPLAVVADVVGSPDLSADCRALYFVAVTEQVRTVYVARR